ncbi:MAG TPA: MgtC/SapB family protein [Geminicoccus sp.]|uniref:MgtC/SapB family protein n=1 Tax=Geminicoccus sp. TaxID=2024832 RepID=UPI002E361968|nr:MgtC/SapB family protein [Geminicoccus sp.]HEX2528499.1 MgtC/SapB family protein [Geminicoccus sp.]
MLALPIAWNHEIEERSAGMRTFPLVAMAACGFIQGTERIVDGVITGIGFIGGGAMLPGCSSHIASWWAISAK